jgi:glycosyltransferase involved in cell wall biosynthesis
MPKVALVANTDWYLYNFRLSLAELLRREAIEVLLLSPHGPFVQEFERRGFRWREWGVGRQSLAPWREAASLVRLASIYHRERPDIAHHFTVKPVIYGALAAEWARVPSVVSSVAGLGHVFIGDEVRSRFLRPVVRLLYRHALERPRGVVTFENPHDQEYFETHGLVAREHTRLIPGAGVDIDRFVPTPEPPGPPVVVLAARMLWTKGVGVQVEAARLLHTKDTRQAMRLALVGEPDPGNPMTIDTPTLESWAREGLVEWWGWRAAMEEVFAACHIVTLPTLGGEGVPTVLLEAAAAGRPVVTTDVPGCRDLVEHEVNGLIVPPNDAPALAAALARLAGDPAAREAGGGWAAARGAEVPPR